MKKAESLMDFLTSAGYISLQMKRSVAGHFEIDAEVENRSVLLLVDTGAGKTVLHTGTAESLGIALENSVVCGGGIGTMQAAMSTAVLKMFRIGSLQIESFPMYMMDFSHVISGIETQGGRKIDGVLGADIFGQRSAIIDYGEAKLYFKDQHLTSL